MAIKKRVIGKDLTKFLILFYWVLFWFFNVIDKAIGGSHFLFVGKDRFAQMERYFDSIGLGEPIVANIALIITAALEVFALVFFCGALYHLLKKNTEVAHSWFFMGIVFTLITFTYFSVGDQVFGDHFELLEHGLFWFVALLSWIIFTRVDRIEVLEQYSINKSQLLFAIILIVFIGGVASYQIFKHNHSSFVERTAAVSATRITDNKYKIQFPFLAGSKAFENSMAKFKVEHPAEEINYIYTAPMPLRLAESDGLIIYIQTEKK